MNYMWFFINIYSDILLQAACPDLFELSGLWHDILQYFAELNTIVS